ncbi:MAG: Hpt domain-containing protein [Betaproteobacteria bacterium]|nr:Hpt domain-containing protein [Betaproteobacteria bacterium]
MTHANEPDLGPLTWVKSEIDQALLHAVESLQAALGSADSSHKIQFAQNHLHQANGALSIIGLDGLTKFVAALDLFLAALVRGELPLDDPQIALGRRALASIANYLEELIHGAPDQPLRLLPLYRELVLARGEAAPSPADLFFPDLSVRIPSRDGAQKLDAEQQQHQYRSMRTRFQRGLIDWLRQSDAGGIDAMRTALAGLEIAEDNPGMRSLWWAGQAFVDAFSTMSADEQLGTRHLLTRIESQLHRLGDGPQVLPERLLRELLYHVASQPASTPIQQATRQAWQLDSLIPEEDAIVSDLPLGPLLQELHTELTRIKDKWNTFGEQGTSALSTFNAQIEAFTKSTTPLGRPVLYRLLGGMCRFIAWLDANPQRYSEPIALEFATALLLAEVALGRALPDPSFQTQAGEALSRLEALARGEELDAQPSTTSVESARKQQEKEAIAQLSREILSSLAAIEQTLDDFFRDHSKRAPLQTLHAPLHQIEGALSLLNENDAISLIREAGEIITRLTPEDSPVDDAELTELARRFSALGFFVQSLPYNRTSIIQFLSPPTVSVKPEIFSIDLPELPDIPAIPATAEPQTPSGPIDGVETFPTFVIETEADAQDVEALLELSAKPVSPPVATHISSTTPQADLDAELLAIFIEEAHEVLESVIEHLELLRASPDARDNLTVIRRSFHTLKGSGRMVGLTDLGEAAWGLEQTLNRWLQLEWQITPPLLELLSTAHDEFMAWVNQIDKKSKYWRDVSTLLAQAEHLRSSGAPSEEFVPLTAPEFKTTPEAVSEQAAGEPESLPEIPPSSSGLDTWQVEEPEAEEPGFAPPTPEGTPYEFVDDDDIDIISLDEPGVFDEESRAETIAPETSQSDEPETLPSKAAKYPTPGKPKRPAVPKFEPFDFSPFTFELGRKLGEREDFNLEKIGLETETSESEKPSLKFDFRPSEHKILEFDIEPTPKSSFKPSRSKTPKSGFEPSRSKTPKSGFEPSRSKTPIEFDLEISVGAPSESSLEVSEKKPLEFDLEPSRSETPIEFDLEISVGAPSESSLEVSEKKPLEFDLEPSRSKTPIEFDLEISVGAPSESSLEAFEEKTLEFDLELSKSETPEPGSGSIPAISDGVSETNIHETEGFRELYLEISDQETGGDQPPPNENEQEYFLDEIPTTRDQVSEASVDEIEDLPKPYQKTPDFLDEKVQTSPAAEKPSAKPDYDTLYIDDVEISRTLFELYIAEAQAHIFTLHQELGHLANNPTLLLPEASLRAAHSCAGISGTARCTPLYTLGKALELAQQRIHDLNRPPRANELALLKTCTDTLDSMLITVIGLHMPLETPELIEQLDRIGHEQVIDTTKSDDKAIAEAVAKNFPEAVAVTKPEIALKPSSSPKKPSSPKPSSLMVSAQPGVHDEIDEQLLPIFLEEAGELINELHVTSRAWGNDLASTKHPMLVKRQLHTLKGSARMAGAMILGNQIHQLESRVESALSAGDNITSLVDEIDSALDGIEQMVAALADPASKVPAIETVPEPTEPPIQPFADDEFTHRDAETISFPFVVASLPETKSTAAAPKAAQIESEALSAALRVRAELLDSFVNDASEIGVARTRIEGELRQLRRSLLDLTENVIRLRNQLREVEIQADVQMQTRIAQAEKSHAEFDPLEMDRYTRLQELTRMMAESVNDVTTVQQNLLKNLDSADIALHSQARTTRELQQALMQVRMVPFDSLAVRLYRIVRQGAKELGKRANLDLRGGGIEIDRSVLDRIVAPLEHLLRNSLAHGIEPLELRQAKGKPEIGQITLTTRQEGNEIVIELADDGAGLDFERIAARAREHGLIGPDEVADERRLSNLIFLPGFTTAEKVTAVSGRGVGMDVVKAETAAVGGRVDISTIPGEGTMFSIYLPLTLAVTQALLVRSGSQLYAIPASMISQIIELKADAVHRLRAEGSIEWLGQQYSYHYLPNLFGNPFARPEIGRYSWILLLHSGGQTLALQVDALRGHQEIIVKNAGPQLTRVVGMSGATVLGNGEIVLIINPVAMANREIGYAQASRILGTAPAVIEDLLESEVIHEPTVMVVDDSLTVRKITSRLLEREGYRVITAKDGVDAIESLMDNIPDVILSDIEMPRMDGFDLVRNIRADAKLKNVPIIMITSRLADKHRDYAMEIGANHYLGKPYQEEELLGLIANYVPRT